MAPIALGVGSENRQDSLGLLAIFPTSYPQNRGSRIHALDCSSYIMALMSSAKPASLKRRAAAVQLSVRSSLTI